MVDARTSGLRMCVRVIACLRRHRPWGAAVLLLAMPLLACAGLLIAKA